MKRFLSALAFVPALALAQPSPAPAWAVVATYLNDPAHEAQAARARAVLDAHGIHSVTTCSAGCTMSVSSPEWAEALRLLRGLVASEHLDLAVVVPGTS